MTRTEKMNLLSSYMTNSAPVRIDIHHPQLRDVLICPTKRGILNYINGQSLIRHDIQKPGSTKVLATLKFDPNCITSGHGIIAAGGQSGELYIASTQSANSSGPSWSYNTRLPASINNALNITCSPIKASSPSFAVSSTSASSAVEPRLWVSNNDHRIKVYGVDVRPSSTQGKDRVKKIGEVELTTPVNHTSVSPDGTTVLAVGDTNEVFLYNVRGSDQITFDEIATYSAGQEGGFSTAWAADGRKFATASQDGQVNVWDTRSSIPLAVFITTSKSGSSTPVPQYSATSGQRDFADLRNRMTALSGAMPLMSTGDMGGGTPPFTSVPYASRESDADSHNEIWNQLLTMRTESGNPAAVGSRLGSNRHSINTLNAYAPRISSPLAGPPPVYPPSSWLFKTTVASGSPGRGPGRFSPEHPQKRYSPARCLKFSPQGEHQGGDLLVFSEETCRIHVVDAETFTEHEIITLPAQHPGHDEPAPHRQLWSRERMVIDREEDEDLLDRLDETYYPYPYPMDYPSMEGALRTDWHTEDFMSSPTSLFEPGSSMLPHRARGMMAYSRPQSPLDISGLSFDPTGEWLYAGTTNGVYEWRVEGRFKLSRKGVGGFADFA